VGKLNTSQTSEFCLEGRFLEYAIADGDKLKGLILGTADGECYVKLAKHLRSNFEGKLQRGTWLEIVGTKKHSSKNGEFRLKAERIMTARQNGEEYITPQQPEKIPPAKKATILMCQKSDCMKRGGRELCQALMTELSDRALNESITIKGMKNCKAAPNLIMPDKTRYSGVKAAQVPALLDKHFGKVILKPAVNITAVTCSLAPV
jgi:NADH:ubiquinone oxidoreductase subunit E